MNLERFRFSQRENPLFVRIAMDTWNEIWANDLYRKLILSVLVLLIQAGIRHSLLSYVINRIPDDSPMYTLFVKQQPTLLPS